MLGIQGTIFLPRFLWGMSQVPRSRRGRGSRRRVCRILSTESAHYLHFTGPYNICKCVKLHTGGCWLLDLRIPIVEWLPQDPDARCPTLGAWLAFSRWRTRSSLLESPFQITMAQGVLSASNRFLTPKALHLRWLQKEVQRDSHKVFQAPNSNVLGLPPASKWWIDEHAPNFDYK